MSLEDEVNRIIDSEAIYQVMGYMIPGAPAVPDEATQQIEAIGALLRGHRLALRHLAREIEASRSE